MYNSKLILALLVSSFYLAPSVANAADEGNIVPPVNDAGVEKPKKSVKELFKPSNKSGNNSAVPTQEVPENLPIGEFGVQQPAPPATTPENMPLAPTAAPINNSPENSVNNPNAQNNTELPNTNNFGQPKLKPLPADTPPEDLPELKGYTPALPETSQPQTENKDKKNEDSFFDKNMEGRSIMFNQISILRVMQVLGAYIESTSNKLPEEQQQERKKSLEEIQQELLARLKPEEFVKTKKDIVTVKLPAYVKVDSILFRSNTNKQAWVNKNKFSEGDNNGEITIRAINPDSVQIDLSTKDTNIDLPRLQNMLKKAKKQQPITIDIVKEMIGFRLGTNQYLDVQALRIKEGNFNLATADLDNKAGHYYDPMKPEDRFVPLEEAEKAAEEAGATYTRTAPSEGAEQSEENFEAIDANEGTDSMDESVEGKNKVIQNEDGSTTTIYNEGTDKEVKKTEKYTKNDDGSTTYKTSYDGDSRNIPEEKSEPLVQFKINKDDPNYDKMQQFAKDALDSGKVNESSKAGYEALANGEDTIPLD